MEEIIYFLRTLQLLLRRLEMTDLQNVADRREFFRLALKKFPQTRRLYRLVEKCGPRPLVVPRLQRLYAFERVPELLKRVAPVFDVRQ